ncbi:unnamed protein product [Sphacelaria rigidula]
MESRISSHVPCDTSFILNDTHATGAVRSFWRHSCIARFLPLTRPPAAFARSRCVARCFPSSTDMQIETINTLKDNYDYYTLTWRQVTDACGKPISGKGAVFTGKFTQGEVKYDGKGRDQLLMFMCSPYGYYEVEIVIVGGEKGASGAVHWEVELGPSEEHIWDTWNPDEYRIPKYNPSGPGTYTFPLEDEDDSHMAKMWPGPEPGMDDCESFGN